MSLLRVNTIRNKEGTGNPTFDKGLFVSSGISTFETIQISSGIVTSSSGIVTYYGDGSKLIGVNEFNVVTQGSTSSSVYPTFATAIGTTTISIAQSQIAFIPSSGNFGIGSAIPSVKLDVIGNANITGVVTASRFVGIGSALTGIVTSVLPGANISIAQTGGIITITAVPQAVDHRWFRNNAGIYTSFNVGIGTTNPLSSLQVGTSVTVYGSTGIVSATQFYGQFKGNADTSTSSGVSSLSSSSVINTETLSSSSHYITYTANPTGNEQIKTDNRGNYLSYIPSSGRLSTRNISVGSALTSPSITVNTTLNLEGTGNSTGDFSVGLTTAAGLILTAANGNKYRLYVSNTGVLSTVLVV